MPIKVLPSGSSEARVMIIGEAPGADEEKHGEPFVGTAGVQMTKMIQAAGILRSECWLTNVCKYRPPSNKIDRWFYPKTKAAENNARNINGKYVHENVAEGVKELYDEIKLVRPSLIIAFGNTPLWALTGEYGITKWRGSQLRTFPIDGVEYPLIPTYHPAAVLRQFSWGYIAMQDLRKAKSALDKGFPPIVEDFSIRPSFDTVTNTLNYLLDRADNQELDLAVDLETKARQIACCGIAWTDESAICIPFFEVKNPDGNYWRSLEEELEIVLLIRKLFTHPNVRIIGQNFPYDQQYIVRYWGFIPNIHKGRFWDTMTSGHTIFCGLPKGLDFLSSFYLDNHIYWKDEGKEWDARKMDEEQLWTYNCRDAVRTWAIAQEQMRVMEELKFKRTQYGTPNEIQHAVHDVALKAMLRGVKIDLDKRKHLQELLDKAIQKRESFIEELVGHPLNPRSPKQLQTFFYTDFGVKPVTTYDRATGRRKKTTNEAALNTIGARDPLLLPLTQAINEVRSLGTFRSVVNQPLDVDNRIRCQYSIPGTETYRFNSTSDAFGYGTNLQNISEGNEAKVSEDSPFFQPNLRKMMVPDEGKVIGKFDGAQADARIVAAEAGEESLLELFDDPSRDLHNENTEIIFGKCKGPKDPNRQRAKMGVHATNYGATARIVASALGITVHQAETFQRRYFGERPAIKEWHKSVLSDLQARRYVENVFGYRRYYFDRIENLLKEALAWIPQSTVAITVNLGILEVDRLYPWAEFLLQVHDEGDFQYPNDEVELRTKQIEEAMTIQLPYDFDFSIPIEGKWSAKSWGDVE